MHSGGQGQRQSSLEIREELAARKYFPPSAVKGRVEGAYPLSNFLPVQLLYLVFCFQVYCATCYEEETNVIIAEWTEDKRESAEEYEERCPT